MNFSTDGVFFHKASLAVIALICITTGCGANGVHFETTELFIDTGTARVPLVVELARTDQERTQGLMYRKSLADGRGMLFVFEKDEVLSFWMKNTTIPLSIAFISAEGRLLEIRDMEPLNLNSIRSSRSVRYALEVPQGWFTRAGIPLNSIVHFPQE